MKTNACRKVRLIALVGCLFVGVGCDPGEFSEEEPDALRLQQATSPLETSNPARIPAALSPPRRDGARDAQYQLGPALPIARLIRGSAPSASDLTASFRALHDSRALYLFVEVRDDRVVTDSDRTIPWEDDAVEIFLDGDERPTPRYDGVDDVHLVLRPGDPTVYLGLRSAPVRPSAIGVSSARTDDGYQLEIAIPWSAVGTTWRKDALIGLDVQVDDDDDGGARDHKLAWASRDDETWQRPDRFGRVRLAASTGVGYFAGLGDLPGGTRESYVTDLSARGDVAVGASQSAAGIEAVRFTMADGLLGLGSAPSYANDVSPNGAMVVGVATAAGRWASVRWRGGQVELLLGGPIEPPGPPQFSIDRPNVVLDDGRVYGGCTGYATHDLWVGCRWDGPKQITLSGGSENFAADAQGNVGGTSHGWRDNPIGSVAVLNDTQLDYPSRSNCITPHDCYAEVRAFSSGAKVAVGTSRVPPENDDYSGYEAPTRPTAFVYTSADGTRRLPDLPGGETRTGAFSISADGRVIGGYGVDAQGAQAVVWIDQRPVLLRELARRRGVPVPVGWRLLGVSAMSADGRTFAGSATNPRGESEGYLLFLANAP